MNPKRKLVDLMAITYAWDAFVAQLDQLAPDAHGAVMSVWYSSNDGCWKYAQDPSCSP
jgi:hypothetical protein